MANNRKQQPAGASRYAHLKNKADENNQNINISVPNQTTPELTKHVETDKPSVYKSKNHNDSIEDNFDDIEQDEAEAMPSTVALADDGNDHDTNLLNDTNENNVLVDSEPFQSQDDTHSENCHESTNNVADSSYDVADSHDTEINSDDIYIQNVVRSPEEIALARQRNELRRAIELEKTQITQSIQDMDSNEEDSLDDDDDQDQYASSIFVNESEVKQEVQKGKKGRRPVRTKKNNFLQSIPDLFKNRTRPRNFILSILFSTCKLFLICILIIGCSGLGAVLGLAKSYVDSLPTLDLTVLGDTSLASVIYDVNGNAITHYYGSENREWASIDEIPQDLRDAVIAIEDVRFYRHMGIDFKRLIGSLFKNLFSNSVQGGSTITQQLVKNQILSAEQTYKRKIREAYIAVELENTYTKDEILEFYLNTIPLGGLVYGVKTAAKEYFDKEMSELTLLECAILAGTANNPTRYNPRLNFYSRNNPERTIYRTTLVLKEMYENGFIEKNEYDDAINSLDISMALWTQYAQECTITEEEYRQGLIDAGIDIKEHSPISANTDMLAFVEYSVFDAITQLLKANNLPDTPENRKKIDNFIRENGYSIYTTLDPEQQKAAEQAVYTYENYPSMRYDADKYSIIGTNPDGSAQTLIQPQAASTVIDYRTGYIVAMVGGRQAPTALKTYNRAYQSTMPVGSSIKPIAVYGPAIEAGLAPGSIMYDTKSPIRNWDTEFGYPRNYNDSGYRGALSLRSALTKSTNTVAAQILMYYVGAENSYNTLVALGVNPEHIQRDGPGLALGTSGIPTLEMAGAYSAIANMGQYIQPISFTKITDKDGNIVLDMLARQERRQVFKSSTAYQLIDMLTSALRTNKSKALIDGQTVGGKTGTTMESRGVFFSGFSGYYACAVWIGSDNYKPLASSTTGSSHAAKLWHNIMAPLHDALENKPIADLDADSLGIKKVEFCKYSGKLATEHCKDTFVDIGLYSDLITDPCTCHGEETICMDTGCIATPFCPNTKKIEILNLPDKGQLPFMYENYRDIYRQYWEDPTPLLLLCGQHSGQWTDEYLQKVMMRKTCLNLLEYASNIMRNNTLSEAHKLAINTYILQLEFLCNDIDNTEIPQYQGAYDLLKNYLDALFPPEIPETPDEPAEPDDSVQQPPV